MALTDNLISYWKLDEASGNALDAHGSNDLTDTNTVGSATGIINNGRDFEDTNSEYFTIADNASLSTGDIDFTVQAWIKPESLVGNLTYVMSKGKVGQVGSEYALHINFSDTPAFQVVSGVPSAATATWGSALSAGTLYHLLAWHDASANQVGITVNDGTPVTASFSDGSQDGTKPFRIGLDSETTASSYFDGVIDECAFWKRMLTAGERTQLYNSGSGLAYPFSVANPKGVFGMPFDGPFRRVVM